MKPNALLAGALTLAIFHLGCDRPPNESAATVTSEGKSDRSSAAPASAEKKRGLTPGARAGRASNAVERTFSSLDWPDANDDKDVLPPGLIKFNEADLLQVLDIYQFLSHRTVIRSTALPSTKIS